MDNAMARRVLTSKHAIAIQLCRAITQWISVRCRQFLRVNEAYNVGYSSMYQTESTRQYWRRSGSAGFGTQNQPCLHTRINNFVETWHFLRGVSGWAVSMTVISSSVPGSNPSWGDFGFGLAARCFYLIPWQNEAQKEQNSNPPQLSRSLSCVQKVHMQWELGV